MAQTVKANFDITRINIFDSRHKMLKRNLGIYIISNFMHNTCVFKHIKTGKRRGVRQKNLLKRLLMRQTELAERSKLSFQSPPIQARWESYAFDYSIFDFFLFYSFFEHIKRPSFGLILEDRDM